MSDEKEAFLRAVIAAPDDDRPRLIYADWLDEHGEPGRAEFIRVQCELARSRVDLRSATPARSVAEHERLAAALRRRERELLDSHRFRWEEEIYAVCPETGPYYAGVDLTFRRGFVAEITCSWQDWLAHHAAILESCPIRNAKDGLVRLTTPPQGSWVDFEFVDGLGYVHRHPAYPGVRFGLPAMSAQDRWLAEQQRAAAAAGLTRMAEEALYRAAGLPPPLLPSG